MRPKGKKRDTKMGEIHTPTTVTTDLKQGKENFQSKKGIIFSAINERKGCSLTKKTR